MTLYVNIAAEKYLTIIESNHLSAFWAPKIIVFQRLLCHWRKRGSISSSILLRDTTSNPSSLSLVCPRWKWRPRQPHTFVISWRLMRVGLMPLFKRRRRRPRSWRYQLFSMASSLRPHLCMRDYAEGHFSSSRPATARCPSHAPTMSRRQ